jgi:hypothetical protein
VAEHDTYVRLRGRYAELLNGKITVEDLDDEELAMGRLKASDGTFRGRPPVVVPAELVQAMRREWLSRAEDKLRTALLDKGIGTLVELAGSDRIDPAVRLRAATTLMERVMGKVPDKIQLAAEDPVEALFRNILADPEGLMDPHPVPKELSAEERELLS